MGGRVGDLLQATTGNFKDNRFVYSSFKTGATYDISLILPAQAIVRKYTSFNFEKLFPVWKWSQNVKKSEDDNEKSRIKHKESCTALINMYLKILAHIARIKKIFLPISPVIRLRF